jgi:hypothetical protein
MKFEEEDSITRLPDDPKELESYFKGLPPEIIKEFAKNSSKQAKTHVPSEYEKKLTEIISRLARESGDDGL